ncbi:MAG: M23 family metallopeptidase [Myxococcota bacterium]
MKRALCGLTVVLGLAACDGAEVSGGDEPVEESTGTRRGTSSSSGEGGKTSSGGAFSNGSTSGSVGSSASNTSSGGRPGSSSTAGSTSSGGSSTSSTSSGGRPNSSTSGVSTTSSTAVSSTSGGPSSASNTASSTSGGTGGCGTLDYLGECQGTTLRWCQDETVQQIDCADSGQVCGWQDDTVGYNCLDSASSSSSSSSTGGASTSSSSSGGVVDNCNGVTFEGECNGTLLRWCENNQLNEYECATDGLSCGYDDAIPGYNCISDPCRGVTYEGECQGALLRYCDNQQLVEYDCAGEGNTCGYDAAIPGYNCVAGGASSSSSSSSGGTDPCGGLDYLGECQGDLLRWCENGTLREVNCADSNRVCQWENETIGYNCLDRGPSCGDLATQNGWSQAACEWNGNGACNGVGTPTWDCDFCCDTGGGSSSGGLGFGYPVGDKTTYPAGGWSVTQILGHYWADYGGVHMAEDISNGEANTALAPVYAVADGEVLYAGSNGSTYRNVVLIRHDLGNGEQVCSFYGHLEPPDVFSGQMVSRGEQVARVLDWVAEFGAANSHLHYVLLSIDLCLASDGANGALVCGYDRGSGTGLGWTDLAGEPETYTAVNDICGDHNYPNAFIAPSKFIRDHHF